INDNLTKLINLLFLEVYKSTSLYKPLKEVANVSNGYAFKSKDLLDVPIDNSSPVFKMRNIKNNGGFDHTKIKSWVTPDYYPKDKFLAQYGDILMSMTDMKDNVRILGHTALMDVDKKYYINQRVCLIRPTELPFEYLYPLTNSDDYINELRKHANHGVQVNLTIKSIKDSKIKIPNNNQLQKYIKLVRPLFEQVINNNQENLIMSQIKCNLLNKFF
ncbi:restriction endonuclease subunit S, partial [Limosilactobacillus agrestis]